MPKLDARFYAKVDKEGPPGPDGQPCWLWMGVCTSDGYGRVWWNGRMQMAHKVCFEIERTPVPAGLELDHECVSKPPYTGSTTCIRPSHLAIVTHAENIRRREAARIAKVRARRAQLASDVATREDNARRLTEAETTRRYAEEGTIAAPLAMDAHPRMAEVANDLANNIPFNPHKPTPRQRAFLLDLGREALYGGAVGGGKSDAILMAALQFVDTPGYAALLLRRTFPDLSKPGALLDRAQTWFKNTGAKYNTQMHTWTFPSGARIVFGYVQNHADVFQYQSSEWQFIAIDEVCEWVDERTYTFLFSRIRRPSDVGEDNPLVGIPLRMRVTGNPTGAGLKWVRDRFIVRGPREGRTYYPARLEDNPFLDAAEYEIALEQLDPYERLRLRHGDWYASPPGSMFRREWFYGDPLKDIPSRIITAAPLTDPDWDWVRYWRYPQPPKPNAEPDSLVGVLAGRHREGAFIVADIQRIADIPEEGEELMRAIALTDGTEVRIRIEEKAGESGKSLIRHLRNKVLPSTHEVRKAPGSGDLVIRAEPISAEASRGNVMLVDGPWVDDFIEEAEVFPDAAFANQVHAVTGACSYLDRRARGIVTDAAPQGSTQANPWENMRVSSTM